MKSPLRMMGRALIVMPEATNFVTRLGDGRTVSVAHRVAGKVDDTSKPANIVAFNLVAPV